MATWSYLIYEIPGNAGLTGFLGYFVSETLKTELHINVPWWLISLATTALVWTLTYRGIQLSARITAMLGGLEVLRRLQQQHGAHEEEHGAHQGGHVRPRGIPYLAGHRVDVAGHGRNAEGDGTHQVGQRDPPGPGPRTPGGPAVALQPGPADRLAETRQRRRVVLAGRGVAGAG